MIYFLSNMAVQHNPPAWSPTLVAGRLGIQVEPWPCHVMTEVMTTLELKKYVCPTDWLTSSNQLMLLKNIWSLLSMNKTPCRCIATAQRMTWHSPNGSQGSHLFIGNDTWKRTEREVFIVVFIGGFDKHLILIQHYKWSILNILESAVLY